MVSFTLRKIVCLLPAHKITLVVGVENVLFYKYFFISLHFNLHCLLDFLYSCRFWEFL